MGAWGTSLYANDSASDIRGEYVDKLRRGKSNEEVTKALIEQNQDYMGDAEEEPLFWYALADTQWNYGRLLPAVKEKALHFLDQTAELERWREAGEKKLRAWQNTLDKLRQKLQTEPPPPKKVSKYRFYFCKWQLGDVYAYRFSSEFSRVKGFFGQYIAFRKVSEASWWPGHIIPVVEVYNWIGSELPSVERLQRTERMKQVRPSVFQYQPNYEITEDDYKIELISTSARVIPNDNLTFLGNLPGDDLTPFLGHDVCLSYINVAWEGSAYNNQFEHYFIDMYLRWQEAEKR